MIDMQSDIVVCSPIQWIVPLHCNTHLSVWINTTISHYFSYHISLHNSTTTPISPLALSIPPSHYLFLKQIHLQFTHYLIPPHFPTLLPDSYYFCRYLSLQIPATSVFYLPPPLTHSPHNHNPCTLYTDPKNNPVSNPCAHKLPQQPIIKAGPFPPDYIRSRYTELQTIAHNSLSTHLQTHTTKIPSSHSHHSPLTTITQPQIALKHCQHESKPRYKLRSSPRSPRTDTAPRQQYCRPSDTPRPPSCRPGLCPHATHSLPITLRNLFTPQL